MRSLSARRAWIEIHYDNYNLHCVEVALRKESVDRNDIRIAAIDSISKSLSARRAWIEIRTADSRGAPVLGRSPQGERG